MLSIGAMSAGQCDYYQNLAREDYYLAGGEPKGLWFGNGAQALGLSGEVAREALSAVFCGFSTSGAPLVQNAGKPNRQPGWDLTFSAPKSVSFLWSQVDRVRQQDIQQAHEVAVISALRYLEKRFAVSRMGKGGAEQVPAGLVVAMFEHSCSRALDMQLHSHALVMNLGIDETGKARSILSQPLYQAKMLAGAFYRCELARQLHERLGVELECPPTRHGKASWFEVKGIPKSILAHFSKRREAILRELGSRGLESASAAAVAALGTRDPKTIVPPRGELHARWKEEGKELGFSPEEVLTQKRTLSPNEAQRRFEEALAKAVAEITANRNYFTPNELTRRTLEISQEFGISAATVAQGVADALVFEPQLFVSLGVRHGQALWTTQELLSLEREFRESVSALRSKPFVGASDASVEAVLSKPRRRGREEFSLSAEQQEAVRYITQGTESIKCVSGFPGSGKTDMLAAAKEILEKEGYRVIGTALAGVASRTLEEQTGIESDSIRMRGLQLYPETSYVLKHHAKQLWRAACGKETFALPKLALDERTVLVIDEAGMVGVRDFSLLAKAVVERGGSIVAVGDERQLSAIERPGSFEYLVGELGGVRLTEIRRQQDPADQDAVKQVVYGNPEVALQHYAEKGQFFVGRMRTEVEGELVSDWLQHGGAKSPTEHRIFAGTRAEVDRLNKLCQWERVQAGMVEATERVEHKDQIFMVGDRVRFEHSARIHGIKKGEGGTVLAAKDGFTGKYVAIALDQDQTNFQDRFLTAAKHHAQQLLNQALGKRTEQLIRRENIVVLPLETLNPLAKTYHGLSLDYAMTTHLGQGQTVKHGYVLLGGAMGSQELSYVQISRHRERLWLYASQDEAGRAITDVARQTRPVRRPWNERPAEVPSYSSLIGQMKRSEAQELASLINQQTYPALEEIQHAR